MVNKIIENGIKIVVNTAVTGLFGALTYGVISSNKNARAEHEVRMAKLIDEYDGYVASNKDKK